MVAEVQAKVAIESGSSGGSIRASRVIVVVVVGVVVVAVAWSWWWR